MWVYERNQCDDDCIYVYVCDALTCKHDNWKVLNWFPYNYVCVEIPYFGGGQRSFEFLKLCKYGNSKSKA